jgi:hypothetical protein
MGISSRSVPAAQIPVTICAGLIFEDSGIDATAVDTTEIGAVVTVGNVVA